MFDALSLLYALGSGIFSGTFPIFFKTEAVLQADVHPVVFQLHKSSWVTILGVSCCAVRLILGLPLRFTWWASASAAAWIPSGLCTIFSVPLIGVGPSVLATAASGSFGVMTVGQSMVDKNSTAVPDERFDELGSFLAAFGVSALLITLCVWGIFSAVHVYRGIPPPALQLKTTLLPGAGAGICWSAANVLAVLAVQRGGNAIMTAELNTSALIVSGLWCLLWYREIRGRPAAAWIVAAIWTSIMSVLLVLEKGAKK